MCRPNSKGVWGHAPRNLFDPRMSRGAFWRIFGTNKKVS